MSNKSPDRDSSTSVCDRFQLCKVSNPNTTTLTSEWSKIVFLHTPKHSSTLFIHPFTHSPPPSFVLYCCQSCLHFTNTKWIPPWKLNKFRPGSICSRRSERLFSCLLWQREREWQRERDLMLLMLLCHCQQFPQNRCKEHKITCAFYQCWFSPSSVSRSCSACHLVCVSRET